MKERRPGVKRSVTARYAWIARMYFMRIEQSGNRASEVMLDVAELPMGTKVVTNFPGNGVRTKVLLFLSRAPGVLNRGR